MSNRALIIVDLQKDYFPDGKYQLSGIVDAAENAARLLEAARASGDLVVHIRHEFPSHDAPFFVAGSEGAEIADVVRTRSGEPVVLKNHANAFRGTNLKEILDSNGINHLVIVGAMSHMCIDATARAAADLGYELTVVQDAIATRDLEFGGVTVPAAHVHAAFMSALSFGYATIRPTESLTETAR